MQLHSNILVTSAKNSILCRWFFLIVLGLLWRASLIPWYARLRKFSENFAYVISEWSKTKHLLGFSTQYFIYWFSFHVSKSLHGDYKISPSYFRFPIELEHHINLFRSSRRRCSVRKGVLQNFTKFTGKHLHQSFFLITKFQTWPATFSKTRLWRRCFLVNFAKFLRAPFLQNTWRRLLSLHKQQSYCL